MEIDNKPFKLCEQCQKENLKSKIFILGSSRTLLGWAPYYDEEGNYHNKDPNKTTTHYQCNNGHKWTEKTD